MRLMTRGIGLVLVVVALIVPTIGDAQTNLVTFETVTFADSSIGFTATTIRPTGQPFMTVCSGKLETAQIRVRYDGTAPSSTVGLLVDVGDVVTIRGLAYLTRFRGIRTGGTFGVVNFHCTRE